MINRILLLTLILSGFASISLCDAHIVVVNDTREIKSSTTSKTSKSLVKVNDEGTSAPKQVKGLDPIKSPTSSKKFKTSKDLNDVMDSETPKTLKKSKRAKYAASFTTSLVISSSKGITAAHFTADPTAQAIVGDVLKQGLAPTSKSPKLPKYNSRRLATYVNSLSFGSASEGKESLYFPNKIYRRPTH